MYMETSKNDCAWEIIGSCDDDDITKTTMRNTKLMDRKIEVDKYYSYLKQNGLESENGMIRTYVQLNNENKLSKMKLKYSCFSKWINADRRGDYNSWNGLNNLQITMCKSEAIVEHIDGMLIKDSPHFNRFAKSLKGSGQYGVLARKFTPAGTFLGYYRGEVITCTEAIQRSISDHMMLVPGQQKHRPVIIDGCDHYSCFGRYYNCVSSTNEQNVSVERIQWTDPQKAICFITNRNVNQGEEFLLPHGCGWNVPVLNGDYLERMKAPSDDSSFSVIYDRLRCKTPKRFTIADNSMYTTQASALAAQFDNSRNF